MSDHSGDRRIPNIDQNRAKKEYIQCSLFRKLGLVTLFLCTGMYRTSLAQSSVSIQLDPVVKGLSSPVGLTNAKDGSNRLFIVEQAGRIRIVRDGTLSGTPFLDLTSSVAYDGGEEGLLGLAFHPDFKNNGRFFVDFTANRPNLKTIIAEFQVSPSNPDIAVPTEHVLLQIDQPFSNHNGGQLAFGPDGFLYIGMGDGGSGGDPHGNGQNRNALLGKILRIDVDHQAPYAIPTDNPFVSGGGAPEIWAWGFRNPWRFSFDRATGRLFVGDVGQNLYEEVDLVEEPGNFGWNIMEGLHCYSPASGCDTTGLITPIHEYGHSVGICVIGGYVYRGNQYPLLQGIYLFGDYGTRKIWALTENNYGTWTKTDLLNTEFYISSFGEDEAGELYVVDLGGSVYRIHATNPVPPNSGTILIPSSIHSTLFSSTLTLLNGEPTSNDVNLIVHNTQGIEIGRAQLTLPPLGIYHSDDILGALNLPLGSFGPLTVEALGMATAVSDVRSILGTGGFFPGKKVTEASTQRFLLNVADTGDPGTAGTRRTNIGLNNPGIVTANVQVSLRDSSGTLLAEKSYTIAPQGMTQVNNILRDLIGVSTVTGLSGYLTLQSDQPIHAWGSQIDNGTDDPSLEIAVGNEMITTGVKLLVPSVVSSSLFKSSLLVVNRESQTNRITVTMRDPAGIVIGTLNRTLPASGFWKTNDVIADMNPPQGTYGPLSIDSADKRLFSAVSEVLGGMGAGGLFTAVNPQTAPLTCTVSEIVDNSQNGSGETFRTNVGINNTKTGNAHVRLQLADEMGLAMTNRSEVIPPNGLTQINQILQAFPGFIATPGKKYYLRIFSDQAVFVWASKIANGTNDPSLILAAQ
jgi:glucose/arabinose dehydrogenase